MKTEVLVRVEVNADLKNMTFHQVLQFIKAHMGGYNDYDIAKLKQVISIVPKDPPK